MKNQQIDQYIEEIKNKIDDIDQFEQNRIDLIFKYFKLLSIKIAIMSFLFGLAIGINL